MRLAGLLLVATFSCAASKAELAEQTYRDEMYRCVDDNETLTDIRACTKRVKAKWGVVETVTDGGRDGAR